MLVCAISLLLTPSTDVRNAFAVALWFFFAALYFYVNVFVNEPPLPPRLKRGAGGALRRSVRRAFGPGARPTLRFGVTFVSGATALMLLAFAVCAALTGNASGDDVLGFTVVGFAMATFACFLLALGTLIRVRTRSGGAARAALFGVVAALFVLPTMTAIILDPRVFDDLDRHLPYILALSPLAPLAGAVLVAERHTGDLWLLGVFIGVYFTLAGALYATASRRTGEIIRQVEAARAALVRHAAEVEAAAEGETTSEGDGAFGSAPREEPYLTPASGADPRGAGEDDPPPGGEA